MVAHLAGALRRAFSRLRTLATRLMYRDEQDRDVTQRRLVHGGMLHAIDDEHLDRPTLLGSSVRPRHRCDREGDDVPRRMIPARIDTSSERVPCSQETTRSERISCHNLEMSSDADVCQG